MKTFISLFLPGAILVDRPYRLSDRIRIGGNYGEADQLELRGAKLTAPGDSMVTVSKSTPGRLKKNCEIVSPPISTSRITETGMAADTT